MKHLQPFQLQSMAKETMSQMSQMMMMMMVMMVMMAMMTLGQQVILDEHVES
jgi:ABC-type Na+ efflux pump permease subunit